MLRSLDEVRELKQSGGEGELQVHGSATLAKALHEAGLVDIYRMLVAPVVVGRGKRIFDTDGPASGFDAEVRQVGPGGLTAVTMTPRGFTTAMTAVVDGVDTVVRD